MEVHGSRVAIQGVGGVGVGEQLGRGMREGRGGLMKKRSGKRLIDEETRGRGCFVLPYVDRLTCQNIEVRRGNNMCLSVRGCECECERPGAGMTRIYWRDHREQSRPGGGVSSHTC